MPGSIFMSALKKLSLCKLQVEMDIIGKCVGTSHKAVLVRVPVFERPAIYLSSAEHSSADLHWVTHGYPAEYKGRASREPGSQWIQQYHSHEE
jgi:hypothetical protein